MAQVTIPKFLTFKQWANSLFNVFPDDFIPVPPDSTKHWQDWALCLLLCNPRFNNVPYPNSSVFEKEEDWEKWAEFFTGIVFDL